MMSAFSGYCTLGQQGTTFAGVFQMLHTYIQKRYIFGTAIGRVFFNFGIKMNKNAVNKACPQLGIINFVLYSQNKSSLYLSRRCLTTYVFTASLNAI